MVFATGLAGVFGASAAYHRVAWSDPARKRMKRLDHSMIFVLIAGTYTPLCLLALSGAWSVVMLATVWAGAVTGIVLKQFNIDGLRRVSGFLYITLGWISIVTLPQLFHTMSVAAFALGGRRRAALHGRGDRLRGQTTGPEPGGVRLPRDLARVHGGRGTVPLLGRTAPHHRGPLTAGVQTNA